MTGIKGKSACFLFLGKFLSMFKLGEMSRFWTQNKYFFNFSLVVFFKFSEIIPNDRHKNFGESDWIFKENSCFAQRRMLYFRSIGVS